jgi:hypothetical protein
MGASLVLSIVGVLLSAIALAVSTLLIVRQTVFMRHANEMPVIVELYQEFRSTEFQAAHDYVLNELSGAFDPILGISKLPHRARIPALKVTTFYTSLGSLVLHGMVDEKFLISTLGTALDRAWTILEPYINGERELRGNTEILAFYEDLVCRTRENYPLSKAYGIRFKRVSGK